MKWEPLAMTTRDICALLRTESNDQSDLAVRKAVPGRDRRGAATVDRQCDGSGSGGGRSMSGEATARATTQSSPTLAQIPNPNSTVKRRWPCRGSRPNLEVGRQQYIGPVSKKEATFIGWEVHNRVADEVEQRDDHYWKNAHLYRLITLISTGY
jgi:hypothetical protein